MTTIREEALKAIGDSLSPRQKAEVQGCFTTPRMDFWKNGTHWKNLNHKHHMKMIDPGPEIFQSEGGIWFYEVVPSVAMDVRALLIHCLRGASLSLIGPIHEKCDFVAWEDICFSPHHMLIGFGEDEGLKKDLLVGGELLNYEPIDGRKSEATKDLTREDILEMVKLSEHGVSQIEIAKRFGINQSTVSRWLAKAYEGGLDLS